MPDYNETRVVIVGNEQLLEGLKKARKMLLCTGIALAAAGVAAILFPSFSTLVVGLMIGWLFLFTGIVLVFSSFMFSGARPFFSAFLLGLLMVAGGAFLVFNPSAGIVALTALVAVLFLLDGAFQTVLAFELRPLQGWAWIFISAIISAATGVVIAAGLPLFSTVILGFLVGFSFLSTGLAFMFLARAIGKGNGA